MQLIVVTSTKTKFPLIPLEILDFILIYINRLDLCLEFRRFAVIPKLSCSLPDTKWAIETGNLKFLNYLHSTNSLDFNLYIRISLRTAAARNHFGVLMFCNEKLKSLCYVFGLVNNAAGGGHLPLVKYLTSLGCHATVVAIDSAAKNGHYHVVKWLCENRTEGYSKALNFAAANNHFEIVEYLKERSSMKKSNNSFTKSNAN